MPMQQPAGMDPRMMAIAKMLKEEREAANAKFDAQRADQVAKVEGAEANAAKKALFSNLGRSVETIGRANEVAHGGPGGDPKYWEGLKAPSTKALEYEQGNLKGMKPPAVNSDLDTASKIREREEKMKAYLQKAKGKTGDMGVQGRHDDKQKLARQKILMQAQDLMVTPRGNRSVQRAMLGSQSGEYILKLFEQYPDLDKMPALDVNLVSEEIATLVGGGKGSDKSRDAVTAKTFQSQWNEFMGKVNNKPTAAQLGAFLKQKKKYVEELKQVNDRQVREYQKAVLDKVKHINPSEDEMGIFKTAFPQLFEQEQPPQQEVQGPNPPMTMGPEAPQVGDIKELPDGTKIRFVGTPGAEWEEI